MTDQEIQAFVTKFAAAWASRDGKAFLELWHPDGVLHSPLYERPIFGHEFGKLTDLINETSPDLVWQLLDWTARADVVVIEWQSTRFGNGKRFEWRGVDRFRLKDGKIVEERVYTDTAPLRAARTGTKLDAIVKF